MLSIRLLTFIKITNSCKKTVDCVSQQQKTSSENCFRLLGPFTAQYLMSQHSFVRVYIISLVISGARLDL